MSVFGPNQVEELIIGNAVATETTIADFIASASDKEIKILSADGSAPAAGKDFKVYQKTDGISSRGLDYEFSDIIKADKVERVILKTYLAETQKSVRIEGFDGNVVANTTYAVEIRLFNDGGSLSPENFVMITGYYTTKSNVAGVTATDIRDGIVAGLNHNLERRGGREFVITTPNATETDILITGAFQEVVAGKIIGKQIEFAVTPKTYDNLSVNQENTQLLSSTIVSGNNPGNGTGKYAINLEWFTKGYKYEVYRQTGYPADFTERTPFFASRDGVYNVIHIKYFEDRQSPTVEKQKKVLTILVDKVTDTNPNNAATNAVLDDLQLILGAANVPGDLPVV